MNIVDFPAPPPSDREELKALMLAELAEADNRVEHEETRGLFLVEFGDDPTDFRVSLCTLEGKEPLVLMGMLDMIKEELREAVYER